MEKLKPSATLRQRRCRPRVPRRRALLLAAPALAGVSAPIAQAAIVYTGLGPAGLTPAPYLFFSLTGQSASTSFFAGSEFALTNYYGYGPSISSGKLSGGKVAASYFGSYYYVTKFSAGAPINNSLSFSTYGYLNYDGVGEWLSGDRGYIGLLIAGPLYGWADVELGADLSITLYGFAYDDSGAPILAGAVPEPATNALLAALAAGSAAAFAARRKRMLRQAA